MSKIALQQFLEEIEMDRQNQNQNDLLESLASLEHDQWVEWAKNIIKSENISKERVERWKKLFVPYENLSDDMKEKDREWGRKVLSIISKDKSTKKTL